jgi:hypothetical protein
MSKLHSHSIKQMHEKAESLERNLKREIEKTITYCKTDLDQYERWLHHFFEPALDALNSKEHSAIRRLSQSCNNLQVFGGMMSWNDAGVPDTILSGLYDAYTEALNFYQECWEQGIV